jgi:hypothetical protein
VQRLLPSPIGTGSPSNTNITEYARVAPDPRGVYLAPTVYGYPYEHGFPWP